MNCYTDEDGNKYYYIGPAIYGGEKFFYQYLNGLDYIIYLKNASIKYLIHNEKAPAIEFFVGDKWWVFNGKNHREDGPCVEFQDGKKRWYYHGEQIYCKDNEEFLKIMKMRCFI